MRGGERKKTTADKDEVDQLLEAAQDEVMLSLSVDSHISAVSADYLDPDLRRRFNALRSRSSASTPPEKHHRLWRRLPSEQQQPRSEDLGETQDDLMARFAALKASLPASSSSSSVSAIPRDEDGGEEDEVEKVIKWAMDAARLDPSPQSDDDESYHCSNDDDNGDDDDNGGGLEKDGKR